MEVNDRNISKCKKQYRQHWRDFYQSIPRSLADEIMSIKDSDSHTQQLIEQEFPKLWKEETTQNKYIPFGQIRENVAIKAFSHDYSLILNHFPKDFSGTVTIKKYLDECDLACKQLDGWFKHQKNSVSKGVTPKVRVWGGADVIMKEGPTCKFESHSKIKLTLPHDTLMWISKWFIDQKRILKPFLSYVSKYEIFPGLAYAASEVINSNQPENVLRYLESFYRFSHDFILRHEAHYKEERRREIKCIKNHF